MFLLGFIIYITFLDLPNGKIFHVFNIDGLLYLSANELCLCTRKFPTVESMENALENMDLLVDRLDLNVINYPSVFMEFQS